MEILVKKPDEAEKAKMLKMPVWECGVSEFPWHYDSEETCLMVEGEVVVEYADGNVSIEAGDYVIFPQGLSCTWKVTKPVKKHYFFIM